MHDLFETIWDLSNKILKFSVIKDTGDPIFTMYMSFPLSKDILKDKVVLV